jgi:deoxycytidine triphosphate deaminase
MTTKYDDTCEVLQLLDPPAQNILIDAQIIDLVTRYKIIDNFDPVLLSGCSYDLRIGQYLRSRNRSQTFDLSRNDFYVEGGECITFETLETLNFRNPVLFGFIVNKHTILARGLFHPITKIDPGFTGPLAITFFNLGNVAEKLTYKQPFASLVIIPLSSKPNRIYGANQRPLFNEGSLNPAHIVDKPPSPLSDKALAEMYGRPISRLYERVDELQASVDAGLIKESREHRARRKDLAWRIVVPLAVAIFGTTMAQNWSIILKWYDSLKQILLTLFS